MEETEKPAESVEHLAFLTARQRSIIFDSVDEQLTTEPMVPTRNRKPMRPNPLATWELRLGNLQVYYDVQEDPEPLVRVRRSGLSVAIRSISVGSVTRYEKDRPA